MLTVLPAPAVLSAKRPFAPLATARLSAGNLPEKTALEVSSVASSKPSKVLSAARMPVIWEMGAR